MNTNNGRIENLQRISTGTELDQAVKNLEGAYKCLFAFRMFAGEPHGEHYLNKADKLVSEYLKLREHIGKEVKW